jgi:CO/xanthine dehydrogenase FAD-binding subunit
MIGSCAYFKPRSLEEAFAARQQEGARLLAGGTDLLVDMRKGLEPVELLVDIKGLEELKVLAVHPKNGATVGGRVTLNALIEDPGIRESYPVISDAARTIATYQLRNRATLVGNICNASPAADMAPPLYVLDAQVLIAGPKGGRTIPIGSFLTGVKKTSLAKGEIVLGVKLPYHGPARMAFMKRQRIKGHDLASVNVAGLADRAAGTLRICIGACAPTPILLKDTDRLLGAAKGLSDLAEQAARLALDSISPIDDVRASAEYRRDMVAVLVKRVVRMICS